MDHSLNFKIIFRLFQFQKIYLINLNLLEKTKKIINLKKKILSYIKVLSHS